MTLKKNAIKTQQQNLKNIQKRNNRALAYACNFHCGSAQADRKKFWCCLRKSLRSCYGPLEGHTDTKYPSTGARTSRNDPGSSRISLLLCSVCGSVFWCGNNASHGNEWISLLIVDVFPLGGFRSVAEDVLIMRPYTINLNLLCFMGCLFGVVVGFVERMRCVRFL